MREDGRWDNDALARNAPQTRGSLLLYLGAAPGVGKTIAMLKEGRRRADAGLDVVVGFADPRDRPRTRAAMAGLEEVAPRQVSYRGLQGAELDLDAVLARHPAIALVDELAHTNLTDPASPAGGNTKRWQDVDAILSAGIDVISTINIQHLESLAGPVERITGVRPSETVPDHVVVGASIRLIDMDPAALRRRLLALYPAEDADRALGHYFRLSNLDALRRLTLVWVDRWAAGKLGAPAR